MAEYDPRLPDRDHHFVAIASVLRATVEPHLTEEMSIRESDQFRAFYNMWQRPPALPGQHMLADRDDAICWQPYFRDKTEIEAVSVARSTTMVTLYGMAGMEQEDSTPGDAHSRKLFRRLVGKMADRYLTEEHTGYATLDVSLPMRPLNLSLLLVQAAALGLVQYNFVRHGIPITDANLEEEAEFIRFLATQELMGACQRIQANERSITQPVGPAQQVAAEALHSLSQVYYMGDSDRFVEKSLATLVPLYLSDAQGKMRATTAEIESKFETIRRQLKRNGIDTERFGATLSADDPEVRRLIDLHARSKEVYINEVNRLHAQLRAIYFARQLVDGLARGTIDYIGCNLKYGDSRHTQILKYRAAAVKAVYEQETQRVMDEALERLAERARALGWTPLPRTRTDNEPAEGAAEPSKPGDPRGHRLEKWRLVVFERLAEYFPSSQVYFRELKRPPRSGRRRGPRRPVDEDLPIDYCVLVIPQVLPNGRVEFKAFGDRVFGANAGYLWRVEWGMDQAGNVMEGHRWEDVFKLDKPNARAYGAMQVKHPSKFELAADLPGAMDRFMEFVIELIEQPLRPRQVIILGGKAVGGVVTINIDKAET